VPETVIPEEASPISGLPGLTDEGEEGLKQFEPEIDIEKDPFQSCQSVKPDKEWEHMIRAIKVRKSDVPSPEEQRQRIRWILGVLESESEEPSESQVQEALRWIQNMQNLIPDHEKFVAYSFQLFYPAWEELLKGVGRKSAKAVLSWIKKGFKPRFGGTEKAEPAKREIVIAMLQKVVHAERFSELLSGKLPHRVAFNNHQSLYRKWGFASDQTAKLVEYGAAGIWEEEEEPVVINPMGIADSAGKDKLICNAKYPNLFLEALPFRYEKLQDLLAFTKHGSFLATWDLKSGYFHVPIHPAYWKYFCFKIGGIVFYFKVLCFGFAQACYVFTKVMQEPIFELRKRGIPISSYIDDALTAARTFHRCARQSALYALFMGALGAYLGLPKCVLTPEQLLKWLGFMIDTCEESFTVGESKLDKIKAVLREVVREPDTTPRTLARVAGKIISTSPAIMPAALFSRSLFQAMTGHSSWDTIFPTPEVVKETAEFWLANIDRLNGRKWWPKSTALRVAVDASGVGYGGHITSDGQTVPFVGTFTPEQATSSSTAREVWGYAAALQAAAQRFPQALRGAAILIEGDNQGAISALNHLRSPVTEINEILKGVFNLCAQFKADVIGRWIPREQLTEADALSREPDSTDWGIAEEIFRSACARFECYPSLDMFASDAHHTVRKFVSQFFSPGCAAVDALRLNWADVIEAGESIWVFPPHQCVSTALSLIERYKVDALICMPVKVGSNELIQLTQLDRAKVSKPFFVPRQSNSCFFSARVPQNSPNPAFLELGIIHISW
jgi:hypothetical protein